VEHIIVGMAHRGRLSTLANVFKKPLEIIFAEFLNKYNKDVEESWGNIGDVKYHLGVTRD
jgi:2-oxoglutarate dehydrogenase E1 component